MKWIPIEKKLPKNNERILLSIEGYCTVLLGTYTCGAFYVVSREEWEEEEKELSGFIQSIPCSKVGLVVNAWRPMPKPYKEEKE